jgi:uncharacterized membrane protein
MAKDVGDVIGTAIGRVAREAVKSVASNRSNGHKPLPGGKGLAAGAGLATLAVPLAAKGASRLLNGGSGGGPIEKAKEKVAGNPIDKVKGKIGEDVKGKAKEGIKDAIPGAGGGSKGEPGVGKGRRMPVQQSMDVPVPVTTAYNEWTQFEEWPQFMHRLESVSQEDETHLNFKTKIWGKSKEFKAEIVEQRPDERIKWEVTEGVTHTGVVTFHEIAPRLTRIEVNIDVQPGSLIEKAARGMRHVKRAVRADMHRFKAHVMMSEEESGSWRGTIEDGDVKRATSRAASSASRRSRSRGASSRSRGSSSKSSGSSSKSSGSSSKSSGSSSRSSGSSSRRSRGSSNGKTTASRAKKSS